MIKDFISPEFVTDSKLCERELRTIEDNISYLENLRLEYLKKLAKLTGKKVWKQHLAGYQNITNYGVGDSPEDLCHYVLNYDIGIDVCQKKIKDKLWEICGKYSLITGGKL